MIHSSTMILINGPQLNYDSNSYSSGRGRAAGQTGTNCGSQRLPEAHLHAGPTVVPRLGPLVHTAFTNDIVLVRLAQPATFTRKIAPIPIMEEEVKPGEQ